MVRNAPKIAGTPFLKTGASREANSGTQLHRFEIPCTGGVGQIHHDYSPMRCSRIHLVNSVKQDLRKIPSPLANPWEGLRARTARRPVLAPDFCALTYQICRPINVAPHMRFGLKIGQNWPELAEIDRNWPGFAQKSDYFGQCWLICVISDELSPNFGQN